MDGSAQNGTAPPAVPGGAALRRWAPLLLVIAVQVALVATVPSRGAVPVGSLASAPLPGGGALPGGDGTTVAGTGTAPGATDPAAPGAVPGGAAGGNGAAGAPGTAAGGGNGSAGTGGTGGAGAAPAPGTPGGSNAVAGPADRSKCAKDGKRQQDVTASSPACVPRFTGDNGGATYQGVTAKEVVVLRYRAKSNPQVDAILATQGLALSKAEEDRAMGHAARFFEKHYEFYGRKVVWKSVQGTCEISPPDIPCFRNEVKRLNTQFKPFAVFWGNATTQAEFFDEWSRAGVLNVGGWHFNAEFNQSLRPFHYDVFMDGTRSARNIADYWCKRMQGKNATLAGDPALRVKKRKLGILTQVYPVTRKNALDLYGMVTGGVCGSKADAAEPVYTPSNIATGQQTANVAIQKLKSEGVTTVVLMVDPINPTFSTTAATRQQWFPEHLMSGMGLVDLDALGRLYDPGQWRNAFGPSHLAEAIPVSQSDAVRANRDVGAPESQVDPLTFSYMATVASLIQVAGPRLTPADVERGAFAAGSQGGWARTKKPTSILLGFGAGDYTAIDDSRQVFWDPGARSKTDGKAGAYVSLEGGRRYEIGSWSRGEPRS